MNIIPFKNKLKRLARLTPLMAVLMLVYSEIMLFWIICSQMPSWPHLKIALISHILSSIVLLISFGSRRLSADRERRYVLFLGVLINLFIPVIGIAGYLPLLLIVKPRMGAKGLCVADSPNLPFEPIHDLEQIKNLDSDNAYISNEVNIEPIVDILNDKDIDYKRGAIEYLSQTANPHAIQLIQKLLVDANPEIRFYAHSTLVRLDKNFMATIRRLQNAAEQHPTRDTLIQLGDCYTRYAFSGLVEDNMTAFYLQKGIGFYQTALDKRYPNSDILRNMAESYIFMADYAGARRCYLMLLKDDAYNLDAFIGLCRMYYTIGNMDALTAVLKKMKKLRQHWSPDVIHAVFLKFWIPAEKEGPN